MGMRLRLRRTLGLRTSKEAAKGEAGGVGRSCLDSRLLKPGLSVGVGVDLVGSRGKRQKRGRRHQFYEEEGLEERREDAPQAPCCRESTLARL